MKHSEPDVSSITAAHILQRRAKYFDTLLPNWQANQHHLSMATAVLLSALQVAKQKLGAVPAGMTRELAHFATADPKTIVSVINSEPKESGNRVRDLMAGLRMYEMAGVRWSVLRNETPAPAEQWTPPPRYQAGAPAAPAPPAPVVVHVHNHLPKIAKSTATHERSKSGDLAKTITTHQYEEPEKETTS